MISGSFPSSIPRSIQFIQFTSAKSSDYTRREIYVRKMETFFFLFFIFSLQPENLFHFLASKTNRSLTNFTRILILKGNKIFSNAHLREREMEISKPDKSSNFIFIQQKFKSKRRRRNEKLNVNKSIDFENEKINSATSFELSTVPWMN